MNPTGLCVLVLSGLVAACGDDASASSGGASEGGAGGGGNGGAAPVSGGGGAGSADGGGTGVGSCLTPTDIALPFAEAAGSTSCALDITSLSCSKEASLPEVVYRLDLATETALTITASDESGQGVGVQVLMDSCQGTSVACEWASNGNVERSLTLPAGSWLFVVERNPAGSFSFALAP